MLPLASWESKNRNLPGIIDSDTVSETGPARGHTRHNSGLSTDGDDMTSSSRGMAVLLSHWQPPAALGPSLEFSTTHFSTGVPWRVHPPQHVLSQSLKNPRRRRERERRREGHKKERGGGSRGNQEWSGHRRGTWGAISRRTLVCLGVHTAVHVPLLWRSCGQEPCECQGLTD